MPRPTAALAAAGVVAALAAATPAPAGAQDAMTHDGHSGMLVLPGPATTTAAQAAYAERLWRRARVLGARWATRRAARRDGYRGMHHSDAGKHRFHYTNWDLLGDRRRLDPRRPESLVYLRRASGEVVLVGLMFRVPTRARTPHPGGALMPWHVHYRCVMADDPVANGGQGPCADGERMKVGRSKMAHVWFVDDGAHAFDVEDPPGLDPTAAPDPEVMAP